MSSQREKIGMNVFPDRLFGLEVKVDKYLEGSKKAVRFGNDPTLYVSPAMHDLISHANESEVKLLLQVIQIIHLPFEPFSPFQMLPMTQEFGHARRFAEDCRTQD